MSRILHHLPAKSKEEACWIHIRSVRWLDVGNDFLYCSSCTLPVWGAKRGRSVTKRYVQFHFDNLSFLFESDSILHLHRRDWTDPGEGGAKRRAVSHAQAPSAWRRSLHDPAIESGERYGRNGLLYSSSHTLPVWGAKRARSALGGGGTQIPPICGAKRARSAIKWYVQFHFHRNLSPLFESDPIHHLHRRDWTDLGEGPAGLIAERLLANDVADYVSFRAVCRSWRLYATDPRKHSILDRRFHPRQWIMLRESGDTPYRPRFMNVSTGYCRFVDLPELYSHDMFPTTEGLLVLLDRTSYMVRLLNPLTRQATNLTLATTLLNDSQLRETNMTRALLKVTGAGLADESTIAVYFRGIKTIAVMKPGDSHWTVVDRGSWLCPALSFHGRFYCATDDAMMLSWWWRPAQITHRGWLWPLSFPDRCPDLRWTACTSWTMRDN